MHQHTTRAVALAALLAAVVAGSAACGPKGYKSCADAQKAGAAPLHRGGTGWNPKLDGDGDGTACE